MVTPSFLIKSTIAEQTKFEPRMARGPTLHRMQAHVRKFENKRPKSQTDSNVTTQTNCLLLVVTPVRKTALLHNFRAAPQKN